MYEALVARVRYHIQKANFMGLKEAESTLLLGEAADAIDELSAYARQFEDLRKDGYYLQKTKMMTYGQATMTMPLPTPPKEEAT